MIVVQGDAWSTIHCFVRQTTKMSDPISSWRPIHAVFACAMSVDSPECFQYIPKELWSQSPEDVLVYACVERATLCKKVIEAILAQGVRLNNEEQLLDILYRAPREYVTGVFELLFKAGFRATN